LAGPDAPAPEPKPSPRSRPSPRGPKAPPPDDESEAYTLGPEEPAGEPVRTPPDVRVPPDEKKPDERPGTVVKDLGERVVLPPEPPPMPAHPLLSGIWTFPGYFYCRGPWFALSIWFLIFGGALVMMKTFFIAP
jgi:hypothetical protein